MKRFLLITIAVLAAFGLLLSVRGSLAQAPTPTEIPETIRPQGDDRPRITYEREDRRGLVERDTRLYENLGGDQPLGPAVRLGGDQPFGPAVSLGQPGLSFRYVKTFGVTEEAYQGDTSHLNYPSGLFIDSSNNVYVVEGFGSRMLKFLPDKSHAFTIGRAGLHITSEGYEDVLDWPEDVVVDGSGNIWITSYCRVAEFDSSGNFMQVYPDWEAEPWNCGSDTGRFDDAVGIAFDSAGRMYISEYYNHRVQIFSLSSGSPVYSATIDSDILGGDFNYPARIVIDSSDRLYVTDSENFRVQRCTYSSSWSCTTFHGTGSEGSGTAELSYVYGISKDTSNNIYIADNGNERIKKCDSLGSCSILTTDVIDPSDVAVDSSGRIYVSEGWNTYIVSRFNSSGGSKTTFAGTSGVPYVTDNTRLNLPWGIAVDSSGNIFASEEWGHRLVKMNSSGTQLCTVGQSMIYGQTSNRFRELRGNLAIDSSGRVYVPDTRNHRVQIYNSNCSYFATIGITRTAGTDHGLFDNPYGVAISPVNGDIYVVDRNNYRVEIFDSSRNYKATLESWIDPYYGGFCQPQGVAVDKNGNIYVADRGCHRVVKFNGSLTYQYTIGTDDWCDWDFDYLCEPSSVAVDTSGRVYITENWNNRVQVFDDSGAYLTTIGGSWGPASGNLRSPHGIAIDQEGNVYITDKLNHRIQKFAPGVPDWVQSNINGFGERSNVGILSLASFNGKLYAGGNRWDGGGDRIWRKGENEPWTAVLTDSFGLLLNYGINDLIEFNNQLYAGTSNWNGDIEDSEGAEIWRSANGLDWTRVISQGFGDPTNADIIQLAIFSDTLYAGTWSIDSARGTEIYRSSTGESTDWTKVVSNGFDGDANNEAATAMEVFNGYLYAGTRNGNTGGEVWRTGNGSSWAQVNADGFNDALNVVVASLAAFNGYLYAGTANWDNGAEIWRCSNCAAAGDWSQIIGGGFANLNNGRIVSLDVFNNQLYAIVTNYETGLEVRSTADGVNWEQVDNAGFGDSNNVSSFFDNSVAVYNNRMYIGTWNTAHGGEVWVYLHNKVYLPLVLR